MPSRWRGASSCWRDAPSCWRDAPSCWRDAPSCSKDAPSCSKDAPSCSKDAPSVEDVAVAVEMVAVAVERVAVAVEMVAVAVEMVAVAVERVAVAVEMVAVAVEMVAVAVERVAIAVEWVAVAIEGPLPSVRPGAPTERETVFPSCGSYGSRSTSSTRAAVAARAIQTSSVVTSCILRMRAASASVGPSPRARSTVMRASAFASVLPLVSPSARPFVSPSARPSCVVIHRERPEGRVEPRAPPSPALPPRSGGRVSVDCKLRSIPLRFGEPRAPPSPGPPPAERGEGVCRLQAEVDPTPLRRRREGLCYVGAAARESGADLPAECHPRPAGGGMGRGPFGGVKRVL